MVAITKYWDGGAWVNVDAKPVFRWNGSSWVDISVKPVFVWDGATWINVNSAGGSLPTPAFVGVNSAAGTGGTPTNATCTLPSGWAPGELAIFGAVINGVGGTLTAPAGWTALASSPSMPVSLASSAHWVGYRVLQSGDTAPVFSSSTGLLKYAAAIATYSGAAFDVEAHANESATVSSHVAPTVTTLGVNRRVVRVYLDKSSTNVGWSDPGSTTRRVQQLGSGGGACSLLVVDAEQISAGATGTATATASATSGQNTMHTIALKGV